MSPELIRSIIIALFSASVGALLSRLAGKSRLFRFSVHTDRVGLATTDLIFGEIRVTWNNNPVTNLFLSTITVANHSYADFTEVKFRLVTGQTVLFLTDSSQMGQTSAILHYSADFLEQITPRNGAAMTDVQRAIYGH